MTASFPKAVIERFDATKTVDIETRSAKGTKHSVPIWIVVVDGVPYVRSVRGPAVTRTLPANLDKARARRQCPLRF